MNRLLRAAAVVVGIALAGAAMAQQRPATPLRPAVPTAPAQPAPPAPEPPPAAYEPLLIKLGEVLGALAFLTDLCREPGETTAAPGDVWRQRMRDIIEAEALAAGQKERFAGAFNRGFAGYATTYRTCTPAGRAAIDLMLRDGARLARELSERYGL